MRFNFEGQIKGVRTLCCVWPPKSPDPLDFSVGQNGLLIHNACSSTSGNNAASVKGRLEHENYNPGPSYNKKYTLPSGRRPDAVDVDNKIVRELKPNNPRAIRRGERQVKGYLEELQSLFGGNWSSAVDTY